MMTELWYNTLECANVSSAWYSFHDSPIAPLSKKMPDVTVQVSEVLSPRPKQS